jgi:hypothetical protein
MREIEKKIISLIHRIAQNLPSGEVAEVLRLAQTHGEYGLAMENLCSLIEENEIPLPPKILDEIIDIFQEMNFGEDVLSYYKEHLTTSKRR